jgi:hypothetical protein
VIVNLRLGPERLAARHSVDNQGVMFAAIHEGTIVVDEVFAQQRTPKPTFVDTKMDTKAVNH